MIGWQSREKHNQNPSGGLSSHLYHLDGDASVLYSKNHYGLVYTSTYHIVYALPTPNHRQPRLTTISPT